MKMNSDASFYERTQPLETVRVAYPFHYTAHENFNWSSTWVFLISLLSLGHVVG